MNPKGLQEAAAAIKGLRRVLVVSHTAPDADAYGSSCALTLALREAGHDVVCINESGPSDAYAFIPGASDILDEVPTGSFDGLIACDCGDARRLGDRFEPLLAGMTPLINIDHHISNTFFGTHNVVEPTASSASEIVFDLIELLELPLSAPVAACLLAGVMGDTGSFRYSSTSAKTFAVAERLVSAGAVVSEVADGLYGSRRLSAVRLQAEALSGMRLQEEGRFAEVLVTEELFERVGAGPHDCENIVESARDIAGVVISAFIRFEDGLWKVSLRSKTPRCSVADIAVEFGGGGHVQAAAFRWRGELAELQDRLRQRVAGQLLLLAAEA